MPIKFEIEQTKLDTGSDMHTSLKCKVSCICEHNQSCSGTKVYCSKMSCDPTAECSCIVKKAIPSLGLMIKRNNIYSSPKIYFFYIRGFNYAVSS